MTQIDFLEKRKFFIELTKKKATGTPKHLAANYSFKKEPYIAFKNFKRRRFKV